MTTQNVSRETCATVGAEIVAAITPILEAHGLTITKNRRMYGDTFKITIEADPVNLNRTVNDWYEWAPRYDIDPEALGKVFVVRGTSYQITGLNPRNRRFPITGFRFKDGKTFKFTAEAVRSQFPRFMERS